MVLNNLIGKKVCGRRSGLPFKDVSRGHECDKNKVPCIKDDARPDHVICVGKGKEKEQCPITDIQFVKGLDELHKLLEPDNSRYKLEDMRGASFNKDNLKAVFD